MESKTTLRPFAVYGLVLTIALLIGLSGVIALSSGVYARTMGPPPVMQMIRSAAAIAFLSSAGPLALIPLAGPVVAVYVWFRLFSLALRIDAGPLSKKRLFVLLAVLCVCFGTTILLSLPWIGPM